MQRMAAITIGVLALTGAASAQQPRLRGETRADHGVVAAGRWFSANAGARVMWAGGNAIDGGVAAVPGSSFYRDPALGRTKLRFTFCKKDETLNAAAERLATLRP